MSLATSGATAFAGGLFSAGAVSITTSSIVFNTARGSSGGDGGSSDNPLAVIVHGGAGGSAFGGGLYTQDTVTLRNSTISTNTAAPGPGGTGGGSGGNGGNGGNGGQSQGGGIYVAAGTLNVRNSTIAKNIAAVGLGGIGANSTSDGQPGADQPGTGGGVINYATVNASSTIFGDNTAGGSAPDFAGAFATASNNLLESGNGATGITNNINGNIVGKDAKLSVLANYGGLTQTHLLAVGSPAINKGNNSQGLTIDQRNLPRVVGAAIDMGATEVQAPKVVLSGTVTYVENAAPLVLAAGATVTSSDRAYFVGGKLTVAINANANANDILAIQNQGSGPGQISVSGSNVFYGGNLIGTFSGGSGTTPLVISFTTLNATRAAVQALARAITFRTVSENPSTATRTIRFILADGDGIASNPATATKFVNVTALPN